MNGTIGRILAVIVATAAVFMAGAGALAFAGQSAIEERMRAAETLNAVHEERWRYVCEALERVDKKLEALEALLRKGR